MHAIIHAGRLSCPVEMSPAQVEDFITTARNDGYEYVYFDRYRTDGSEGNQNVLRIDQIDGIFPLNPAA